MHSHTLALVGRLGRGKRLPRLPARKLVSLLLRQLGKVGRHAPRVVTREQNSLPTAAPILAQNGRHYLETK